MTSQYYKIPEIGEKSLIFIKDSKKKLQKSNNKKPSNLLKIREVNQKRLINTKLLNLRQIRVQNRKIFINSIF